MTQEIDPYINMEPQVKGKKNLNKNNVQRFNEDIGCNMVPSQRGGTLTQKTMDRAYS